MFRLLAYQGADPRAISEVVNGIMNGKTNNTGYITLATGGALTTTLYDERISPDSKIVLLPASAAAFADSAPYGSFSDSTDQPAGSANTPVIVAFGTTDYSNGVTLSNSNRLNVANDGVYNIQFSAQLQNTTNDAQYADIWFRVNTNDVAGSASRFGIPARKSTGATSHMIGAMNIFLDLNAGDYVQLVFAVSDVGVTFEHYAADTGVPRPAIPSIIATVQYIAPQAYSNIYVSAQTFGSATISHWANSTADKTYSYIIVG